jgi:hypothetical protein
VAATVGGQRARQVESAPAVALGLVVRWRLARSPQAAAFLRPAERAWLLARCASALYQPSGGPGRRSQPGPRPGMLE